MTTAPHSITGRENLRAKKWGYLLFIVPPLLPFIGLALARWAGPVDLAGLLTPFVYFVLIPILDYAIGQDRSNPPEAKEQVLSGDLFFRALTLLCLPIHIAVLAFGAHTLVTAGFSFWGGGAWVVAIGLAAGVNAINPGHELIHKDNRFERTAGGLLLALCWYGTFKIEHVLGHHVHVATPKDNSTALRGENVYGFIARAFASTAPTAWAIEAERLKRRGRRVFSLENEVIRWTLVSLGVTAAFTWAFGWLGAAFFIGQSVIAIALLEIINYVEHYGLMRSQGPNGRYERVSPEHSWNSNFTLTNLLLFQLQRHSDHHANGSRRYQALRHFDESPQLPFGYATMVVLALAPPLWRGIMHPLLDAHGRKQRAAAPV